MSNGIWGRRARLVAVACAAVVGLGGWTAGTASPPLLIAGATIFDATGAPPFQGDVLVRDGRIAQVAPTIRAPSGATVVDARGKALLPGFFDLHTHWTPGGSPAATPSIAHAYVTAGVTTVNDFHQPPEAFEPRRRWLADLVSPHVNLTARMSTPGGHGADWADQNTTRWVNTPDGARAGVETIAPYSPDLIKAFADGWRYGLSADNSSMDESVLSALVAASHEHDLRVVTHTVTVDRGAQAARAGVDVIVHSLQDREIDAATAELMRAGGVAYAPTLAVYEPVKPGATRPRNMDTPRMRQQTRKFAHALNNVRRLHEAGVLIALGTDAGMPGTPHGVATLREMELLVQAGLSPTEALLAATSNSAKAMGVHDDRGSIEVGKRADLVLIDGTPWRDIADVRRIHGVFIDGRQVHSADDPLRDDAPALMPAIKIGSLIDDFERPDRRTALDTARLDHFDGGGERTELITQVIQDASRNHYLSLAARMAHKDDPFAGVTFPLSRGGVEPVDLSAYQGLRFDVRGDGGAYQIRLRGPGGVSLAQVEADAEWRTVDVPFEAFRSSRRSLETEALFFDLTVRASREGGEAVWLELDNVALY